MELFSISLHDAEQSQRIKLYELLVREYTQLHNIPAVSRLEWKSGMDRLIGWIDKQPEFRLTQHGAALYQSTALAIAEYIVSELEPLLLSSIVRKQYRIERPEELDTIVRFCSEMLGSVPVSLPDRDAFSEVDRKRRRQKVADELELYLQEHTELHLTGFVTFRLQAYWNELRDAAEYAVDEFVMDKQYQEFISLLKYFVDLQDPKLPLVHLVHKSGHEFMVCDERLQPLEHKPVDRIVAEMVEYEMNVEDMVISTLVTISPKQIIIHTRQPELQIIRTIESIFGLRVSVCVGCGSCHSSFENRV
ncbi:putative sporulation protein YtxC [Paenibacillus sp. MMS18-CY102]|uniref:putative sporulation protein YtxC n=1 Tax=Paenibacillus sp. MMS18-CY102 TaxID=2682849 RepID=UPI0013ACED28|nr:putative sporulation protein YtxC [Paenibacillus sp. MMS18-CY102]MWC26836.1 sporulation protein [Paenibacillus sp. MMS18-CY102]